LAVVVLDMNDLLKVKRICNCLNFKGFP
jgi:hypothetical protein